MRVLVLGASGSGTSTLGRALASSLAWRWLDLDDFYWEPSDPPFTSKRDRATRLTLITAELATIENAVVSGSPLSWGAELEDSFDVSVFVTLDTATRLQRLRARELELRGAVNDAFLAWAARYDDETFDGRSRATHEAWLADKRVIRIDGKLATGDQVAIVRAALFD